jgi:microcystin-dependent protein
MPFDSSGTFNRLRSWVSDAAAGIKVRADYHDDEDNGFAAGLSQCLTKDGRTQPTANIPLNQKRLVNVGDPVAGTDAAHKQYVDNAVTAAKTEMTMPPGVMMPYAKSGAFPAGWLYCNGQAISRTAYDKLYALIGNTFGSGDNATTFNLPDMRGRFPRGWDDGKGLDPSRTFGSSQTDDFEAHTHTASSGLNSVGHTHTFSDTTGSTGVNIGTTRTPASNNPGSAVAAGTDTLTISGTTGAQSANHTHAITVNAVGGVETRPHNLAICWIIKT